jgi:hypothetical protein
MKYPRLCLMTAAFWINLNWSKSGLGILELVNNFN